jgi:predicted amidohydrolase
LSGAADRLLQVLDPVADDAIRVAAILWTWLDQNRMLLGSLRRKPLKIRADSLKLDRFERIGEHERKRIRASPISAAAELLVRIHTRLIQEPPHGMHRVKSVDGDDVIVMWKLAPLMFKLHEPKPPSAVEQPSLTALAPQLVVCPLECRKKVRLESVRTVGPSWRAAFAALEQGCAHDTLSIHLDSLGDAGLEPSQDGIPGWVTDDEFAVGWFDETCLEREIEACCEEAVADAIQRAADPHAVLVLPELVATAGIEHRITVTLQELNEQGQSPALTVVGLYHRASELEELLEPAERASIGEAALAKHVNEAIVLGPDGRELWRHRKLSAAEAHTNGRPTSLPAKPAAVTEDIAPGRTLQLADSPIGWLALLICIDVFAEHLSQRLERSGADVLLVPSLSPTVHRHRNSVQLLVQRLWGAAFVCNRAPSRPKGGGSRWNHPENRSFWAIARYPPTERLPHPGSTSIVFRLDEEILAR